LNSQLLGNSTVLTPTTLPHETSSLCQSNWIFRIETPAITLGKHSKKSCKLRVTISLLTSIRKFQFVFYKAIQERHAGKIMMVRPDTTSMAVVIFAKCDGEPCWSSARRLWRSLGESCCPVMWSPRGSTSVRAALMTAS
jgi:hypothetical protein